MAEMSIPDQAAAVVEKHNAVKDQLERLKAADKDFNWTQWHMAVDEATIAARDGLRQSWKILDRLHSIMRDIERGKPRG